MTLSLSALFPMEKASTLCQFIYKTFISEQDPKGFVPFPTVYIFRYCVGYMGFLSVLLLKIRNTLLCGMRTEKSRRADQSCRWTYGHSPLMEKHKQNECSEINCSPKTAFLSPLNPFLLSGCQSLWVFSFLTRTATEESFNGLAKHVSFT